MRKLIYISGSLLLIAVAGLSAVFYVGRGVPVVACVPVTDSIRPRTRCILNPFRDTEREQLARGVLKRLSMGDIGVLEPFLSDRNLEDRASVLDRESVYRIRDWRVGNWFEEANTSSLQYWVNRDQYDHEEEVTFSFERRGTQWRLVGYTAIY